MDISVLITSVGSAMGIAKGLLGVKAIADSAEAKMAIAELTSQMADIKVNAAELRVQMLEKDDCIRELEAALKRQSELVRYKELYFEMSENGEPAGDPFCPKCFEEKTGCIHLVYANDYFLKCPSCENTFPRNPGEKRPQVQPKVRSRGFR